MNFDQPDDQENFSNLERNLLCCTLNKVPPSRISIDVSKHHLSHRLRASDFERRLLIPTLDIPLWSPEVIGMLSIHSGRVQGGSTTAS